MASESASTFLWGGRFSTGLDDLMMQFNESLSFDKCLCHADIQGSITFARALRKLDILTEQELAQITDGLRQVGEEWDKGTIVVNPKSDEDIHTINERRLGELIGTQVAGKLHTGRSRNEQVGVDMRLWARTQLEHLSSSLKDALRVFTAKAGASLP
ncbi:hypothetical protein E4U41_002281, partial [Claviceps citrina]